VNQRKRLSAAGANGSLVIYPEVEIWLRVLAELRQTSGLLGRLDLDQHVARISEQQAAAIAQAWAEIVTELRRQSGQPRGPK